MMSPSLVGSSIHRATNPGCFLLAYHHPVDFVHCIALHSARRLPESMILELLNSLSHAFYSLHPSPACQDTTLGKRSGGGIGGTGGIWKGRRPGAVPEGIGVEGTQSQRRSEVV